MTAQCPDCPTDAPVEFLLDIGQCPQCSQWWRVKAERLSKRTLVEGHNLVQLYRVTWTRIKWTAKKDDHEQEKT